MYTDLRNYEVNNFDMHIIYTVHVSFNVYGLSVSFSSHYSWIKTSVVSKTTLKKHMNDPHSCTFLHYVECGHCMSLFKQQICIN